MQTNQKDEKKNKASNDKLNDVFSVFLSKYKPAKSKEQAEIFLTTDQIYSQVYDIYPSQDFKRENVYDLMQDNGFSLDIIAGDDVTFYWLLMKR